MDIHTNLETGLPDLVFNDNFSALKAALLERGQLLPAVQPFKLKKLGICTSGVN